MGRFNQPGWRSTVITCLLLPAMAQAELTIIYDTGHTQPIAPFLEVFDPAIQNPEQSTALTKPRLGAADPESWLPIQ